MALVDLFTNYSLDLVLLTWVRVYSGGSGIILRVLVKIREWIIRVWTRMESRGRGDILRVLVDNKE